MLSIDRTGVGVGDVITILAIVAVRVIDAVGSCMVCTKTFGA